MMGATTITSRTAALALATVGGIALAATACGGEEAAQSTGERPSPLPVVVDYSPTVSDAGALLYLASHPAVDLLAVTLAGTGESRCEAALPNTLGLLALAGVDDVPVACGPGVPMGPGHEWPSEWRDAADRLAPLEFDAVLDHDRVNAELSGVDLLADTAAATDGLVVVALGPLTNLAAALDAHPELAEDVAMLYTMGGAIGVTGNAPNGAEWNYYVDPSAVDVVVRSEMPVTIVPLDATNHVPVDAGIYERMRGHREQPLFAIRQLWTDSTPWRNGSFLWDELTAMLAVDPSLAPLGTARITVVTAGDDAGRTLPASDGHEVLVAGRPNRRRAETAFLTTLAGASGGGEHRSDLR